MNFIKISLSKRDEIYFCCCQEFYLGNTLLLRLYKKMAPLSIYEKWCIQQSTIIKLHCFGYEFALIFMYIP